MAKNILYFIIPFFIVSCSARKKYESNPVLAQKLYKEGQQLLSERVKIQDTDTTKAMDLNKKVLEKFEAAYTADTTNPNVLLFASECSMYERDYKQCLNWTLKFVQDTAGYSKIGWSNEFIAGFYERIGECYAELEEVEKSKPYYEKASVLRKKSGVTQ